MKEIYSNVRELALALSRAYHLELNLIQDLGIRSLALLLRRITKLREVAKMTDEGLMDSRLSLREGRRPKGSKFKMDLYSGPDGLEISPSGNHLGALVWDDDSMSLELMGRSFPLSREVNVAQAILKLTEDFEPREDIYRILSTSDELELVQKVVANEIVWETNSKGKSFDRFAGIVPGLGALLRGAQTMTLTIEDVEVQDGVDERTLEVMIHTRGIRYSLDWMGIEVTYVPHRDGDKLPDFVHRVIKRRL